MDSITVALRFNECINNHDTAALVAMMTEDHRFIDRDGNIHQPRTFMEVAWRRFFDEFPVYRNTFTRVISKDDLVIMLGFAFWSDTNPHDPVIWTAMVEGDKIREWRVCSDTETHRRTFGLA